MNGVLYLIRHRQSAWNAEGLWTGQADVPLTPAGYAQAHAMGETLRHVHFDTAFTSMLCRTQQTLQAILRAQGQRELPGASVSAFNERDYGDYTGKNKLRMKEYLGPKKYLQVIKAWDEPVPSGETLKQTSARVIRAYHHFLLPKLAQGQTVLLVSHCQVIRTLVKFLEEISDEAFTGLELSWDNPHIYTIGKSGKAQKL